MSISAAISNAVSGLTAASRGTETVSTNIANARTEGYARRELELSARIYERGGGVSIDGVRRMVNASLLADNRLARAQLGSADTIASFHAALEDAIGTVTQAGSLGNLLTAFDAAVVSAAARPDSDTRLSAVLDTAQTLAQKINSIANTIQSARTSAEQTIANDVARLNSALDQVTSLNKQIASLTAQGKDASSMMDSRQAVIDGISAIVPIRQVPRDHGQVALFTTGGAVLLDGTNPARVGFSRADPVTVGMSLAAGTLSNLTFNDSQLTSFQQAAMFSGGTLGANFAIRDDLAPEYQRQIDAYARDLYDRVSSPEVDTTLPTGGPGLFTDDQSAFLPANESGFANRLAVSALVDPTSGGQLWRIRAGMNAGVPGEVGESSLLNKMSAVLSASRAPGSTNISSSLRTLHSLTAEISSNAASSRIRSEATALQNTTHYESLRTALLADGVDTDKEMESLLALEQAYSANAKVFQTANDMLDTILRLT